MLDTERSPAVRIGVITCRRLLYYVIILLVVLVQQFVVAMEASCGQVTLRDQLKQSFKVLKLGHARSVKSCINLCCGKKICDLALFKRGRCYGIGCSHQDLCRGILKELGKTKRDISKRSVPDTSDFASAFSHHGRSHGFCRQRRVIPHHVFLGEGRGMSNFRKLSSNTRSMKKCNQYCCEKEDCSLAFIMGNKCYGVICPDDGDCNSSDDMRVPLHLEVALIHRGLMRESTLHHEVYSTSSRKRKAHRHTLKFKPQRNKAVKLNNHRKDLLKYRSSNRHYVASHNHRHRISEENHAITSMVRRRHKSKKRPVVKVSRNHVPAKHRKRHGIRKNIQNIKKQRMKESKAGHRKHPRILHKDDDEDDDGEVEKEKKEIANSGKDEKSDDENNEALNGSDETVGGTSENNFKEDGDDGLERKGEKNKRRFSNRPLKNEEDEIDEKNEDMGNKINGEVKHQKNKKKHRTHNRRKELSKNDDGLNDNKDSKRYKQDKDIFKSNKLISRKDRVFRNNDKHKKIDNEEKDDIGFNGNDEKDGTQKKEDGKGRDAITSDRKWSWREERKRSNKHDKHFDQQSEKLLNKIQEDSDSAINSESEHEESQEEEKNEKDNEGNYGEGFDDERGGDRSSRKFRKPKERPEKKTGDDEEDSPDEDIGRHKTENERTKKKITKKTENRKHADYNLHKHHHSGNDEDDEERHLESKKKFKNHRKSVRKGKKESKRNREQNTDSEINNDRFGKNYRTEHKHRDAESLEGKKEMDENGEDNDRGINTKDKINEHDENNEKDDNKVVENQERYHEIINRSKKKKENLSSDRNDVMSHDQDKDGARKKFRHDSREIKNRIKNVKETKKESNLIDDKDVFDDHDSNVLITGQKKSEVRNKNEKARNEKNSEEKDEDMSEMEDGPGKTNHGRKKLYAKEEDHSREIKNRRKNVKEMKKESNLIDDKDVFDDHDSNVLIAGQKRSEVRNKNEKARNEKYSEEKNEDMSEMEDGPGKTNHGRKKIYAKEDHSRLKDDEESHWDKGFRRQKLKEDDEMAKGEKKSNKNNEDKEPRDKKKQYSGKKEKWKNHKIRHLNRGDKEIRNGIPRENTKHSEIFDDADEYSIKKDDKYSEYNEGKEKLPEDEEDNDIQSDKENNNHSTKSKDNNDNEHDKQRLYHVGRQLYDSHEIKKKRKHSHHQKKEDRREKNDLGRKESSNESLRDHEDKHEGRHDKDKHENHHWLEKNYEDNNILKDAAKNARQEDEKNSDGMRGRENQQHRGKDTKSNSDVTSHDNNEKKDHIYQKKGKGNSSGYKPNFRDDKNRLYKEEATKVLKRTGTEQKNDKTKEKNSEDDMRNVEKVDNKDNQKDSKDDTKNIEVHNNVNGSQDDSIHERDKYGDLKDDKVSHKDHIGFNDSHGYPRKGQEIQIDGKYNKGTVVGHNQKKNSQDDHRHNTVNDNMEIHHQHKDREHNHEDDNESKPSGKDNRGNKMDHNEKGNRDERKDYSIHGEHKEWNDNKEKEGNRPGTVENDKMRLKNQNNLRIKDHQKEKNVDSDRNDIEEITEGHLKNGSKKGDLRNDFKEEHTTKNTEYNDKNNSITKVIKQNHGNTEIKTVYNSGTGSGVNDINTRRRENHSKQDAKDREEHAGIHDEKIYHRLEDEGQRPDNFSTILNNSSALAINKSASRIKTITEFPVHKHSLYHSLKQFMSKEKDNGLHKGVNNTDSVSNSNHDIMKANQNYSAKLNKSSRTEGIDEENQPDKMKYFNQETSEWRESRKGDDVEDNGKYFNQVTRDWSVIEPNKDDGEYFHNLTSDWNLKSSTRKSDSEKYFNQRMKEWIGKNQSIVLNKTRQSKLYSPNNPTRTGNAGGKVLGGLMEFNKFHEIQDNATDDNDKKTTHKNKDEKHVFHFLRFNNLNETFSSHPGHNKTANSSKGNQTKRKHKTGLGAANVRNQHFVARKTKGNNTNSSKDDGIVVNESNMIRQKQNVHNKVKSKGNVYDTESEDEKVKSEILKLIGQEPIETVSSKQNKTENLHNINNSLRTTPLLINHSISSSIHGVKVKKPAILSTGMDFPTRKTIHTKPAGNINQSPRLSPPYIFYHQDNDKQFKNATIPSSASEKKSGVKIFKAGTKVQTKKLYQNLKKQTRARVKKKNTHLPIRVSLSPKPRVLKPLKSAQIPERRPQVQKKSRPPVWNDKTETNQKTNHVNKEWPSTKNSWKPKMFENRYSPYSNPTVNSVQNWNKQNNILRNEWNAPWEQYYGGANIQAPTARPTVSWNNMNWYSKQSQQQNIMNTFRNTGIEHGNRITKPSEAPVYQNGIFPLVDDGDKNKDFWKSNTGNYYGGSRQDEPSNINPVSATTRRRNFVFDLSKQNNKNLPHSGQKEVRPTTKPQNFGKGVHIHKSLKSAVHVPPSVPQRIEVRPNPPKPTSKIEGHRGDKKVLGNTRKRPEGYQKPKPKSAFGNVNILQTPHVQHQNIPKPPSNNVKVLTISQPTFSPHKWTRTNSTFGIVRPFEINKIEPLHSTASRNLTTASRQAKRPLTTIPKGCFPGEIMSEMTLADGLDAGNFTKIGKTELMDTCISKCCGIRTCDVALQMDNVCFTVKCHSKETCKIKTTLGKSSHHKLCFITRKKKERQNTNDFDDDFLGTQDTCPKEEAVGLQWKKTIAGSFDEIPCPKKANGVAKRKCSIESKWLLPDFSGCISNDYEELYKRARRLVYGEDMSSLLQSLAVVTTRTIDNSLIFGGDLKKTTEIMTSIVQEQGVKLDNEISHKDVKNFLVTCSNLLDDSNKQEWKNIQKNSRGSADILRDSQTFALLASAGLPETNGNMTYVTNNIVLQVSYQAKGSKAVTFPDYDNAEIAIWDGEKDNIKLPASIFSIGDTKIVTFSYKTLPVLLPKDSDEPFRHSEPNSKILTSIVEPRIQDKITPPVTITLHHLKENRVNPRCVFWDFNLNPTHGGAWSTKGCWLERSDRKHSVCRCNHLSNFAVLMDDLDTDAMQVSSKDQHYSREMAALWISVPVVVVLIIGGLYTAFSWSRGPTITPRTLDERSSLLRSSVTTQEIRYDYSLSPSRHLYAENSPSYKELEWQNEFEKNAGEEKDQLFNSPSPCSRQVYEPERDSGIESNDHDDSSIHCDLSLSQDDLSVEDKTLTSPTCPIKGVLKSSKRDLAETETIRKADQVSRRRHLEVERRVFSSKLRRCIGNNDLSNIQT